MASWLVFSTLDQEVQVLSPDWRIVNCVLGSDTTRTCSASLHPGVTHGPVSEFNAGVTLQWTCLAISHPVGIRNIPSCFMLQNLLHNASLMVHLACLQTLFFAQFILNNI